MHKGGLIHQTGTLDVGNNLPQLRKALGLMWQLRSDPYYREHYVSLLHDLATYEVQSGSEGSKDKMVQQIVRTLPELEWPKIPGDEELLKLYLGCIGKLKSLGHTEEAFPISRERIKWLEGQVR